MEQLLELGRIPSTRHLLPSIEIHSARTQADEQRLGSSWSSGAGARPDEGPSQGASKDLVTRYLSVSGMTCAACSSSVEKVLRQVEGVEAASVSLMQNLAEVVFDANTVMVGAPLSLIASFELLQRDHRKRSGERSILPQGLCSPTCTLCVWSRCSKSFYSRRHHFASSRGISSYPPNNSSPKLRRPKQGQLTALCVASRA